MATLKKKASSTSKKSSGTSDLVYRGGASKPQTLPYKGESGGLTKLPSTKSKSPSSGSSSIKKKVPSNTSKTPSSGSKKSTPITGGITGGATSGSGQMMKKKMARSKKPASVAVTSSALANRTPSSKTKRIYK